MTNASVAVLGGTPNPFGRYRIDRKLRQGGMGQVFLAYDTDHGDRAVALKLIEHGADSDAAEALEAERRGASLQQALAEREPRVVQVFDSGDLYGFFYIAMEYIEGQDLAEVLKAGPMEVRRAVDVAVAVLEVLHRAHTMQIDVDGTAYHGIVHGDIKPGNVRLTPVDAVRVLDFGISKALSATRRRTRNVYASEPYASPERLASGEVDVGADLWAMAVVLYEMLTGWPYLVEREIRSYRCVKQMPENLPASLRAILRRALEPEQSLRYPSAQAFHDDLRAFEEGLPTSAEMGEADSSELTRRTGPVAGREEEGDRDDQPTRRTPPAAPSAGLPPPSPASPSVNRPLARPAPPKSLLHTHWRRFVQGALVGGLVFGGWHEYRIYSQGSELSRDLLAERIEDINAAWTKYQDLAQHNYLPYLLYGPRKRLKDRMTSDADHVLSDFRENDTPSVNLADWKEAVADLARVLELSPDDAVLRGKLRVCEGHVLRINATGKAGTNSKLINESRQKFEEARELWRKAPDPYLGLMRVYIYGLKDIDRAEEALREAEHRGYRTGRREKAQLADGYRERADQFVREAARARTVPEGVDYLTRAESDYQRAEDLYQGIVPFPGAASGLRRAQESREKAGQQRDKLKNPAPDPAKAATQP
jgi:serine/threonine protein kinase